MFSIKIVLSIEWMFSVFGFKFFFRIMKIFFFGWFNSFILILWKIVGFSVLKVGFDKGKEI